MSYLSFKWKNFRAFKETCEIEVRPLTIIIGCNGTGKSCLLQPLLLLGQTLDAADKSVSLMTHGNYVTAGSYTDLVFNHSDDLPIELSFDFVKKEVKSEDMDNEAGSLPPSGVSLTFTKDDRNMPKLKKFELFDKFSRSLLRRNLKKDGFYSLKFFDDLKSTNKHEKKLRTLINKHLPEHFIFDPAFIIREQFQFKEKKGEGESDDVEFPEFATKYFSSLFMGEMRLKDTVNRIKYIGPVREYPRRFYEYSGEFHPDVGSRGEYAYSLLYQLVKDNNLLGELNYWLQQFGLAEEIDCQAVMGHPDLLEIVAKDKSTGLHVNFADTCFGLSQALPLLVQAIMSDKDDVVITEQPEIHLNPACETTLADFFVSEVKKRESRFIIESHSEHFLLRLRTHVRKGNIDADNVAIYFAEQGDLGASVRRIEVDDNGDFPNDDWPKGFFGQALEESMMFATSTKSKTK